MITWDTVLTALFIGLLAGIGQAVGGWLIMRSVLRRIDAKDKVIHDAVQNLHLTKEQKIQFARSVGSEGLNYLNEYGRSLKDAALWWRNNK